VKLRLQHRADGRDLRRLIGDEMDKHSKYQAIKTQIATQMADYRGRNTLTKA
jgi:hypothetical protein